ncbi:MAG: hypothetical protein GY777_22600 [Candidatus Brocadiaceae bacterium]|nr:hypothetical protein [Candidatus Brocadiaceae bacterium]
MSFRIVFLLAVFLSGCVSNTHKSIVLKDVITNDYLSDKQVLLRLNMEGAFDLKGDYNYDELSGQTGGMVYPAYNGATFITALVTHAVVNESLKSRRKQAVQNEANKVVEGFKERVASYDKRAILISLADELSENTKLNIVPYSAGTSDINNIVVETNPIFYMTQDQNSLFVENVIRIYSSISPEKVLFENLIEKSIHPDSGGDIEVAWLKDRLLEKSMRQLYLSTTNLMFRQALGEIDPKKGKVETFTYFFNGEKQYERGRLVVTDCQEVVISTLRGWLKVIPVNNVIRPEMIVGDCQLESGDISL